MPFEVKHILHIVNDKDYSKFEKSLFQALQLQRLVDTGEETDYVTLLSNDRGWLPLQKEESMTVTINDKVYEITRKQ